MEESPRQAEYTGVSTLLRQQSIEILTAALAQNPNPGFGSDLLSGASGPRVAKQIAQAGCTADGTKGQRDRVETFGAQ